MFNQYPYINIEDLNLDYLMARMRNLEQIVKNFVALESVTFSDPIQWDITKQYAKNTVVLNGDGDAFISVKAVPVGVYLNDGDYWLEIFNFMDYVKSFNSNLTFNIEANTDRASVAYSAGDWLLLDDILYKVIVAIPADGLFEVGVNIEHFTVEDFIKAWINYANGLIVQYKNDIDASELLYRQQLAGDIANTTASLQAQLDAAIAGATVDSEVINARIGWDSTTYATLGDAIRTQVENVHNVLDNIFIDITNTAIDGEWNTGGTTYKSTLSTTSYGNAAAVHLNVAYGDLFIINATCTSGGRAFYVLNASDEVIRWYDESSLTIADYIIQIYEPDAAKIIIQTSNKNTNWRVIKSGIAIADVLEVLADNSNHSYRDMAVAHRWYTGTSYDQPLTETTNSSTKSAVISVNPMDGYKVSCTGGSGGRAYYILDSSDNVIGMAANGADLTDQLVVMPFGAAKFVVQTNNYSKFEVDKAYDFYVLSDFVKYFAPFFIGVPISGATSGDYWTGNELYGKVTNAGYGPAIANLFEVQPFERYLISGTSGGAGAACYVLDEFYRILSHTEFSTTITDREIVIPANGKYMIAQSTQKTTYKCNKLAPYEYANSILKEDAEIAEQFNRQSFTSATKYLNAELSHYESNKINIAFIGDSWTQGTPDSIDSGKYESYVKWLSLALWDKYGFGGLGWLDFGRDGGTGKMFGCVDLYDHWTYAFNGTISGVDGSQSDADAAASLGLCCAHTEFGAGATLHLTFDAGYLDRFTIKYYKDAHFYVSINGGANVEVTANNTDGWQSSTFGTIGTDTTDVLITAIDDSIIFGMNCGYGNYGIKCHKIGNRSLKLERYLMMDGTQFETALSQLDICWCSLLFAINDLGNGNDYAGITQNYISFIDWIQSANGHCDINILGCANISSSSYANLPILEKYLCKYAASRHYGWASSRNCIGADKTELAYTNLFSDTIHLNKYGSRLFGEYIAKYLF